MMGDGIAVIPDDGKIYAPCNGKISMVMDNTKHALGIETEDGMELLIHVGLDTVNLMGEGFATHVSAGDSGETFNRIQIKSHQIDVVFLYCDKFFSNLVIDFVLFKILL